MDNSPHLTRWEWEHEGVIIDEDGSFLGKNDFYYMYLIHGNSFSYTF